MASWNPKAHQIFLDALDFVAPTDQQELILAACAGDSKLLQEVNALLAAHRQQDSLLKHEDAGTDLTFVPHGSSEFRIQGDSFASSVGPGTKIGPYQLVEVLGQGGMGTVFLAEQFVPVRRQVALKLIRVGMDTEQVVARFASERQALALMDHPNIARVLDAGSHQGLPYFVMELVRGVPLNRYCEHRCLSIRQRLELFREVAHAIQHAHQKGIIHRDLKPSNILVTEYDNRPTVKVIDFGLAKALEDSAGGNEQLTVVGGILGTPEYMSPEQARGAVGQVDTRTDIYSLGVILYELLTGSTPLTRQRLNSVVLQEVLRLIQEEDPPAPSSRLLESQDSLASLSATRRIDVPSRLPKMIRGELDWIVMKALEKETGRRYESVGDFCADIENFLSDRPVTAGPVSRRYRAWKFIRRYRILVGATAGVLAALLLGLIGTVWGMLRAYDAEQTAIASQQAEFSQRKQAEAALKGERAALRERSHVLSDMFVDRGWSAAKEGDPSLAALWFCEAASLVPDDHGRVNASLLRARNMLSDAVLPVAAMRVGTSPNHLNFNSLGNLVAVHSTSGFAIWDWRRQERLPWTLRISELTGVAGHGWHPDGNRICVAESNGSVHLRDAVSGEIEQTFRLLSKPSAIAMSYSGTHFAAGVGNEVRVWDFTQQKFMEHTLQHDSAIRWLSWSADDQLLATIDRANSLRIFRPHESGQAIVTRPRQSSVAKPAWKRSVPGIYLVEELKNVPQLTELAITDGSQQVLREFPLQLTQQREIAISSDESSVVVASYMGVEYISLTDAMQTSTVFSFPNEVWSVDFIAGTPIWLGTGRSAAAKVQATAFNGEEISISLPHFGIVEDSDVSADGKYIATVQGDGLLRIWQPNWSGAKLDSAADFGRAVRLSHSGRIVVPGEWPERPFGPIGTTLQKARLWDSVAELWIAPPRLSDGDLIDSQMIPGDEQWAVLYRNDEGCALAVIDLVTGATAFPPRRFDKQLLSIDVNPVSSLMAVLDADGRIEAVEPESGQTIWSYAIPYWRFESPFSSASQVRFSPDGSHLVAVVGKRPGAVHVLDAKTGRPRFERIAPTSDEGHCRSVEFSLDSGVLAIVSNGHNTVRCWSLENGAELGAECHHPGDFIGLFRARFSADATRIVTSHADGFCRQFDWRTGKQIGATFSHGDEVFDAAYLDRDKYLFTVCRDGNCYLWDVQSGTMVSEKIPIGSLWQTTFPTTLQLVSAGQKCVVSSAGGKAHVLDLQRLVRSHETNVPEQLALCEVLSGRRVINGSVSGLLTEEWMTAWHEVAKGKNQVEWGTPMERVESMLRLADIARSQGDAVQERRSVQELFRESSLLPLDDVGNFRLHALVIRFLGRSYANIISHESLDAERHRLMDVWHNTFADHPESVAIGGIVADAWLACEQLQWNTDAVITAVAEHGTALTQQENGEFIATGPVVAKDRYVLTISDGESSASSDQINTLLLDVIPDANFPKGGSGRDVIGNFFLSKIEVHAVSASGEESPVEILSTNIDYTARVYRNDLLLDDDANTGWSVDRKQDEPHWLLISLPAAIDIRDGNSLRLSMDFASHYKNATLGRFRVSVGRNPQAALLEMMRSVGRATNVTADTLLMSQMLLDGQPEAAVGYFEQRRVAETTRSELPFLVAALAYHKLGQRDRAIEFLDKGLDRLSHAGRNWSSETLGRIAMNVVLDFAPSQSQRRIDVINSRNDLISLTKAIEQNSNTPEALLKRASWYAERQAWTECALDRQHVFQMNPDDSFFWLYLAPTQVFADQLSAYEEFRKSLLSSIQQDRSPERLERFLKSYCLAPLPQNPPELPVTEMLALIEAGKGGSYMPMYGYAVAGLASMRQSQFEQAIEWSRKARPLAKKVPDIEGLTLIVEALSLYELQRFEEAAAVMLQLANLIPEFPAIDTSQPVWKRQPIGASFATHDRLVVEILRNEVRNLIENRPESSPFASKTAETKTDAR